jgi:RND superfamily putative drug exporter
MSPQVPAVPRPTSAFTRLGAWVTARPRAVCAVFALGLALSGGYAAEVARRLPAGSFDVPGSDSFRVTEVAQARLGVGKPDLVLLYERTDGGDMKSSQAAALVSDALDAAVSDPDVLGVTSYYDTSLESLLSRDGRRALVLLSMSGDDGHKVQVFRRLEPLLRDTGSLLTVSIGGNAAAANLAQETAARDIRKAESIALPIAALLMLFFFRSAVAALLPVGIGALCVASGSALAGVVSHFLSISVFALNVCAFLGLGLSIDYALLLVQRFREELALGRATRDAVIVTLDTAGHAVWTSGLTVAVSLLVLVWVPVPLLRSVAVGGVLAVATALLGALVALPALLAWLGPRVNRFAVARTTETGPSPFWQRVGRLSMRHPIATAIICSALLLAIASPALRMKSIVPDARMFGLDSEVRRVEDTIGDPAQFDPSGASSIQVLLETEGPMLAAGSLQAAQRLIAELARVPGVAGVRTPLLELDPALDPGALARAAASPRLAPALARSVDDDLALVVAIGAHPWRSEEAAATVARVRALSEPGLRVSVGGPTAQLFDSRGALRDYGAVAAVLVVGWNLAILLGAFRSLVVPLKAVLMNVLSLGASYGVLVWVFQEGHLAGWLGIEAFGGIDPTIPLVMFAVVFGLSMDYEVFLLSRIQEEYRRTRDNQASVIEGLARTGRVISSAALILFVVIGAFAAGDLVYVKELGVGMGSALLLDVTLVRALLVPATMQLLGRWNWWAPRWLAAELAPLDAAGAPRDGGDEDEQARRHAVRPERGR